MSLRQWAVRFVFAMLAFVAVGAIIGGLSDSWFGMIRVFWTGAVGCLAGLIAIPLTGLVERPTLRLGAVGSLAYLGLETVLLIGGIWLVDSASSQAGERLLSLAGALSVTLLPAVVALYAVTSRQNRAMAIVGMIAAGVAALLTLPAIADGFSWDNDQLWRYFVVGMCMSPAALLAITALLRRQGDRLLPGALIAVVPLIAMVLTVYILILDREHRGYRDEQTIAAAAAFMWASSAGLSVWYALRVVEYRGAQSLLRHGFLASSLSAACLLGFAGLTYSQAAGTLGTGVIVVAICFLVGVTVIFRLNRRAEFATQFAEIRPGSITCPRCHDSIELRPGPGACLGCGLRFKLELEAARCRRCAHDLAYLQSPVCPECGESIRLAGTPVAALAPIASGATAELQPPPMPMS